MKQYLMVINPYGYDSSVSEYNTKEELLKAVENGESYGSEFILAKRLNLEITGDKEAHNDKPMD